MEHTDYQQPLRPDTPTGPAGYGGPQYQGAGPRRRDLPYKNPTLAGFLSGLMPGLGQVYVGYFQLGITFGLVFAGCVTMLSTGIAEGLEPLFGLTLAFTYLFGIVDAARRAGAYNRYLEGLGTDAAPPEMTMAGWGGSRAGGVVLILLGVLLSLRTMFDLDLEWLEDVWPLFLVGLGIWLFVKARRERDSEQA